MKKMKRFSAFICAGALVMTSMSAYAADTSKTVTGSGALENEGSSQVEFDKIVLPTMTDGTYDFTLDPNGLLEEYGGTTLYATGKKVYFNKEKTAATLKVDTTKVTGAAADLYRKGYEEDAGLTSLKANISTQLNSTTNEPEITNLTKTDANTKYYVWAPKDGAEGEGDYKEITVANFADYFNYELKSDGSGFDTLPTLKTDKVASCINDGKVYKTGYEKLDFTKDDKMSDYVTFGTDGEISALSTENKLYSKLSSGATYTEISTAANLDYDKAERQYTDTSDVAKVVNKSSSDKVVKVKVSVTNGDKLTFVENSDLQTDKTKANVALSIVGTKEDGTDDTPAYVEKKDDGTYSASLSLPVTGIDTTDDTSTGSVIKYQGSIDSSSGGHQYKAYLKKDVTYKEVSFKLQGGANSASEAQDAWDAYAQSLKTSTTNMRPGITVVYSIKDNVTKISGTPEDVTANVSWGGDGLAWFNLGNADALTQAPQLVCVKDGEEEVYTLKADEYSRVSGDTYIGVSDAKAAGASSAYILVETVNKLYKKVLW